MVASYGETSGFTAVNENELALVNGGKGGGGGGSGPYTKPNTDKGGIDIGFRVEF